MDPSVRRVRLSHVRRQKSLQYLFPRHRREGCRLRYCKYSGSCERAHAPSGSSLTHHRRHRAESRTNCTAARPGAVQKAYRGDRSLVHRATSWWWRPLRGRGLSSRFAFVRLGPIGYRGALIETERVYSEIRMSDNAFTRSCRRGAISADRILWGWTTLFELNVPSNRSGDTIATAGDALGHTRKPAGASSETHR